MGPAASRGRARAVRRWREGGGAVPGWGCRWSGGRAGHARFVSSIGMARTTAAARALAVCVSASAMTLNPSCVATLVVRGPMVMAGMDVVPPSAIYPRTARKDGRRKVGVGDRRLERLGRGRRSLDGQVSRQIVDHRAAFSQAFGEIRGGGRCSHEQDAFALDVWDCVRESEAVGLLRDERRLNARSAQSARRGLPDCCPAGTKLQPLTLALSPK